ncbi:hypothetical protein T492DRAFT_1093992 [Pavlovales sp. CCMP2436]|nr:hypothetical protein T492DRAFT_1093992 [Pavlovales sp. CCMP2436]
MRSAGVPVDSPAARVLLAATKSAALDFQHFEKLAAQLIAAAESDEAAAAASMRAPGGPASSGRRPDGTARAAFTAFDRDRNGLISSRELRAALRAAGADVSDSQSLALIREADLNSDGRLSLAEFERLAGKLPAAPPLTPVAMPASYSGAAGARAAPSKDTYGSAARGYGGSTSSGLGVARPSTARARASDPRSAARRPTTPM